MKAFRVVSMLAILGIAHLPAGAQEKAQIIILDLANPTLSRTIQPGTYRFRIDNRLPSAAYTTEVVQERLPIDPLTLPHAGESPLYAAGVVTCDPVLKKLETALTAAALERDLPGVFATWNQDAAPECKDAGAKIFAGATQYNEAQEVIVSANQQLKITITRKAAKDSAKWTFVMTTPSRGSWRTLYGFTFVPDRDDHYYTRQVVDTPTKFVVTKKESTGSGMFDRPLQFLPSVLFMWEPENVSGVSVGFTGGLGYNFERMSVLGGLSINYNENISLTLGGAVHPQALLNGKYKAGDVVTTNLEASQLHEDHYRPNLFFGMAFRLGTDPFARASTPAAGGSKPSGTAADQAAKPGAADSTTGDTHSSGSFDPATITTGAKVGAHTVTVSEDGGAKSFTFDGKFSNLEGSYTEIKIGETTFACISLSEKSAATVPTPKGSDVAPVCFAPKVAGTTLKTGNKLAPLDFHGLKITTPKNATPVYTATVDGELKAAAQ